jgi:hypothetical protein
VRADIACLTLVLAAMAGLDNYEKLWHTALHVTVSALIVAIPGLAIGHGDAVGDIDVADRIHRPLHHHQLEHGAANRLEA